MRFFLCLFYIFHRRYSNCRPLNSAQYNRIICQTVENVIFWEDVVHTARFGERLPRLQIQFRISRSFRPRNLANLGSKIRFWIRRKEHTLRLRSPGFIKPSGFFWAPLQPYNSYMYCCIVLYFG